MIESYEPVIAVIVALIALLEAVYALLKREEVKTVTAEKDAVIRFYDQDNDAPIPADVVQQLPPHTYTMSDAVRQFVLHGLSTEDQTSVTRQIVDAEFSGEIKYTISYSDGWYRIEYGQIAGGGRGPARAS
ncbi:MAG: hypothetical protein WC343_01225 [Bacilli bacterium]|jgi:hypothetical protein